MFPMVKSLKSSSQMHATVQRTVSRGDSASIRRAVALVRLSIFPPITCPPSRSNTIDLYALPVIPLALLSRGNNIREGVAEEDKVANGSRGRA